MNTITPTNPEDDKYKKIQEILKKLSTINASNIDSIDSQLTLTEALKNEDTRQAAMQQMMKLNPDTHKLFREKQKKLSLPYYKESYGKELVTYILNPMLADSKSKKIDGVEAQRWSINTLDAKVRQAWDWIIDYSDPDKKYKNLRSRVEIVKKSTCLAIIFKSIDVPLRATDYSDFSSVDDVLVAIKDIVENYPYDKQYFLPPKDGSMQPFALSGDDIIKVETFCAKFSFIVALVGNGKISISKFTPNANSNIVGGVE